MSLRLLRAEVWAQEDVKKLHRVTIKTLPEGQLDGPAIIEELTATTVIEPGFTAIVDRDGNLRLTAKPL